MMRELRWERISNSKRDSISLKLPSSMEGRILGSSRAKISTPDKFDSANIYGDFNVRMEMDR